MERYADLNSNDELREFLLLEEILKETSHFNSRCNNTRNLEESKIEDAMGSHVKMMDDHNKGAKTKESSIHDSVSKILGFPSSGLGNKKGTSTPVKVRQSRSNFTVPQPFNLSSGKRTSFTYTSGDARYGHQPQKPQVSRNLGTTQSTSMVDASKHQVLRRFSLSADTEQDKDDIISVSSIQSSQAPRAKPSRFTSINAFKFHSDARAEQRKEFYSKLQEKASSKEKEKMQRQANTKRDVEEELKALHKSLTFKASPLPSFYHGGTKLARPDFSKVPTTGARSTNFSRQYSASGVSNVPHNLIDQHKMEDRKIHADSSTNTYNASEGQDCQCLIRHKSLSATNTSNMQGSHSFVLKNFRAKMRNSSTMMTKTPLIVLSDLVTSNKEAQLAYVQTNFSEDEAED